MKTELEKTKFSNVDLKLVSNVTAKEITNKRT